MSDIIITRFDEVVETIDSRKDIVAVLSIEHPGVKEGGDGAAPRISSIPQKILCFWDSEEEVKQGPELSQVEEGLEFLQEHINRGSVLIHCRAGKSRSVAMALGLMSVIHPNKSERELVDDLLNIRPEAAPNIIVVKMLDDLTGRKGKLLQAVLDNESICKQREFANTKRKQYLKRNPRLYKKLFPEKW